MCRTFINFFINTTVLMFSLLMIIIHSIIIIELQNTYVHTCIFIIRFFTSKGGLVLLTEYYGNEWPNMDSGACGVCAPE